MARTPVPPREWAEAGISRLANGSTVMRFAASEVEEGVVPDSGHWIMEENPKATIALVRAFLDKA
jgi:pimeloyl-ACP methyl ester carboxylesterase